MQINASIILRTYFLLICFSLFLMSCGSSSQFQYLAPEYKNRNETVATLMVLPFITKYLDIEQREFLTEKKNSERKPITNREIDLFDNYITQLLADNTQVKVSSSGSLLSAKDFKVTHKKILSENNHEFNAFIPSIGNNIFINESPDYLALFTDLYLLKNIDDRGATLGRASDNSYSLDAGLEYVLWDVKNEKIAAYGKLKQKLKLLDTPAKEDYLAVFEKFAVSIIQQSPFAVRKIYF